MTLITGPVQLKTQHSGIIRVDVESAEEMYKAAQAHFPDADAGILCAAVADYRPATVADKKIKREKVNIFDKAGNVNLVRSEAYEK